MQRFILVFLAVIGLMSILLFFGTIFVVGLGVLTWSDDKSVPASSILEINFEQPTVEDSPEDAFARLMMDETLVLRDVVDAIDRAADDGRVEALLAHVSGAGLGLAQLQDVRNAVLRFRESGKPAIAFAESFGEFRPGNSVYYLASAFDEIYMQPSGDVNLTGFYLEHPFIRGSLDKLDVIPRMGQRYEYKNAANLYTQTEFTDAHREASQRLIDSLHEQLVEDIAAGRGMNEAEVIAAIDQAPLHGNEAIESKLVDELLYVDEVYARIEEEHGGEYIDASEYIDAAGRPRKGRNTVALIFGHGNVVRGKSSYDGFNSSSSMGSATVAQAFRDAIDDDAVDAIVFRVSSPGGSYIASDTIWRETKRARESGKPVIVSMGDYAASGGYFVSMSADHILAQPGTLTGSIGVLGGKLVLEGVMKKIGVSFDDIKSGENASMFSPNVDYSESEWNELNDWLDRVYEDFTGKVSENREIPLDRTREIARGRVWTGRDAVEIGLVDEIGDLYRGFEVAAEMAGISEEEGYRVRVFPAKKTTWELLMERGAFDTQAGKLATVAASIDALQPIWKLAEQIGIEQERSALWAPLPAIDGRRP